MIRRQKIGNVILGTIVQQRARADARPIIVEYNSCNRIFLGVAVARCVEFAIQNVGLIRLESQI